MQPGSELKIDFDIESREYNGRWYTDIKAWSIEAKDSLQQNKTESAGKWIMEALNNEEDELPF